MTEEDYHRQIRNQWPEKGEASLEVIALCDEAVARFPQSPRLWCMRGNLITLGPENTPHSLVDALASYQRASEIDPSFAEAWDEIGHYHDAILGDEEGARQFFERAATLKRSRKSPIL